ncbi:thermonuclease family protein [Guyparkeria hydrothermalis]|uniref:thermonuclease family protein n=1 Tax=Guyparkeria hydrothermalis TaxID=923 RepID=UPI002022924D|nr:thermonuclease family protein [Guyparkeria hydrothermalis]MCL7745195.1 thermonuclease family protein [Guyparkeria hydrothermalis]
MVAFLPFGRTLQEGTVGLPGALFRVWLVLLVLIAAPLAAADCRPAGAEGRSATVGYVNDGDTVRLTSGERVRLVGIDTPEIGYDGNPDESLARESRQALQAVLAGSQNRVEVVPAREEEDRYGRTLAYLYLPGGASVQGHLLEEGMAMAVFVAPNLALADCLMARERVAREERRGIWSLPAYEPGLPSADGIPEEVQGAAIVRGRVVSVGESRRNIWINLEGRVAVRIDKADREHFPGWDFDSLEGERLRVRGWIVHHSNRYQDWFIPVDSAHALERLD